MQVRRDHQCTDIAAVSFAIDGRLADRIVWRAGQLVRLPALEDRGELGLHQRRFPISGLYEPKVIGTIR